MPNSVWLTVLVICTAITGTTLAQQFSDVSATSGILAYSRTPQTGGVAAADYDDDGDIDLFVPNGPLVADQIYVNVGGGQFQERAEDFGLASTASNRAGLWFDFDGDEDLDLVVAGDCYGIACPGTTHFRLYEQVDPEQFVDVTVQAGLPTALFTRSGALGGLSAGDLNRDGYLDLCVSRWQGELLLFENNADGTFSDISLSSGVGGVEQDYWQPVMLDMNEDGWLDIFCAVDFFENEVWINQQDGTFQNVAAAAGLDNAMNDMGVAIGDYDNDHDLDLYITNITNSDTGRHNVLFRKDSADPLSYVEVSASSGVQDGGWGWGTTFGDFDNDGWLDLTATNGFLGAADESKYFRHPGTVPPAFVDASAEVGFNDTYLGTGLVGVDYDTDGDLDLVHACVADGPLRLMKNDLANDNHYLTVRPRQPGPNHRAIGAVVRATFGGMTATRLITAGISMMCQEPAEAHFGLGTATVVEELSVEWPDGATTVLTALPVDRVMTVTPTDTDPEPPDVPAACGGGIASMALLLIVSSAAVLRRRYGR
jgi:hypothetical protein